MRGSRIKNRGSGLPGPLSFPETRSSNLVMLLLLDNYDSFTFNLAHYLIELGQDVQVHRNDALTVEQAVAMAPHRVVISPGPGRPETSGVTLPLITALAG